MRASSSSSRRAAGEASSASPSSSSSSSLRSLFLFLALVSLPFATTAVDDTAAAASAADAEPPPAPAQLIATSLDAATGLRTDTFWKPLRVLTPGTVVNSRPWGAAGRLARPAPDQAIHIARFSFDFVNADTNQSLPLDQAYNHHVVFFSQLTTDARKKAMAAMKAAGKKEKKSDGGGGMNAMGMMMGSLPAANLKKSLGYSTALTPCGVGSYFAGGGAEWRGEQATETDWMNHWVEPPGTEWGANVHLIDLRDVVNTRNAVQCNCEAYSTTNPGTPMKWDRTPMPGGGIACCGDGAQGPVTPAAAADAEVPVAIIYNVTWMPKTPEAEAKMPKTGRGSAGKVPMRATLMVSSAPGVDGASCAAEYNARPCAAAGVDDAEEAAMWQKQLDEEGDMAPAPTNQTCELAVDGSGVPVTVAWSHPFKLPEGAAYDVDWMVGHQHIGGRGISLINTTAGAGNSVVCDSLPRYGTQPGVVGDEKGFIVSMGRCLFDPPLRILGGESYVVRSEYGADKDNFAPAAFPPPYEGVMGYMSMYFTIPEDKNVSVFSASGNRTLETAIAAAAALVGENATNTGVCIAPPPSGGAPVRMASNTAAATASSSVSLKENGGGDAGDAELDVSGGGFVQLSPKYNFTMEWQWEEAEAGDDKDTKDKKGKKGKKGKKEETSKSHSVAFKLRLEAPTWMAIGIHRPGGSGMPNADMIIVESRDDGANFMVREAWTMEYGVPRPKTLYGSSNTSGLSGVDCAVTVSGGVIEATFTRAASIAPTDQLGANITRGEPAAVVWAFGADEAGVFTGFSMDYHRGHRGTALVTW